jgi:hypothetical protein
VLQFSDAEATVVSDVVFLLRREAGWAVQLVGRYTDVLHPSGDGWLFHHRSAEFIT